MYVGTQWMLSLTPSYRSRALGMTEITITEGGHDIFQGSIKMIHKWEQKKFYDLGTQMDSQ